VARSTPRPRVRPTRGIEKGPKQGAQAILFSGTNHDFACDENVVCPRFRV
jgi:hypothetical protein